MITILISCLLIVLALKELVSCYRYYARRIQLDVLLEGKISKKKIVKKKSRNEEFEKIIAKNSVVVDFLRRFQNEQTWKIYGIVIVFSCFFILNQMVGLFNLSQEVLLVAFIAIVSVVIIVPERIVKTQTERKIREVSKDLPLVIDIMAIMIKSGMTIENCFRYLSTRVEPINKDIAIVLERACLLMDINGIEAAIDLIYKEVPSKEMRMFCINLKRSINYGNSIYDALLELSAEMREMQRLDIEEKIAAISAKMTVPMMLFILFPVLVVIAGPVLMRLIGMF